MMKIIQKSTAKSHLETDFQINDKTDKFLKI